jgi:hypothetical protein
MNRLVALAIILLLFSAAFVPGQPKPPDMKDKPKLIVAIPIGVAPGKTSKLTIRGLRIDTTSEIRVHDPKSTAKLLGKTKVAVPNQQDPALFGDSQIEIEVTLPEDYPMTTLSLSVVTPAGESPPYRMLVDPEPAIGVKEPNNSFKNAQAIQLPQRVDGVIGHAQDVDVFRFEGKEGQAVVAEVFAARYGSPLDSFLTLYNADGQIIASNDDHNGSADSRIETTLPKAGVYYLSLIDANDQGGPTYVYRLAVRAKK